MVSSPPSSGPTGSQATTAQDVAFTASRAWTSREVENVYRHVGTLIGALRSEMKGEIAIVMATIREAEAQRSVDYQSLKTSLDNVRTTLPTTFAMWKIVGSVVGFAVGLLALLWTAFGAGQSITGLFADEVLEQRTQQADIQNKLNILLEQNANDNSQASAPTGQTRPVRQGP